MSSPDAALPRDRFGNALAPGLPYARGRLVGSTADDLAKLDRARRLIARTLRERGPGSVFDFTGLDRKLALPPGAEGFLDDELAPALWEPRLEALALEHLGGDPARHDALLLNRMTAATVAAQLALVEPGQTVVGLSPSYSHPTVARGAAAAGARFVDVTSARALAEALDRAPRPGLVVLTRLAVSYDLLPIEEAVAALRLCRERGVRVYADDAGGARVGPAAFGQPKMLELDVALGATGMDKYGLGGPRLGLLAGERELVARIRARAWELGLEARPMLYPAAVASLERYRPERVRELVATTGEVADALEARLGARVHRTPVTAQLRGEDTLEAAAERAGVVGPELVPVEATAALAMILLEDHGILTVHFAALPPGTSALLIKFVPPETLARFGGADAFAKAVDGSLDRLAGLVGEPARVRALLYGGA